MLMATIDGSIVLIALPDIFRGIGIDPLEPGNTFYLLWMILGFLVVTSVLVVSLGRLGDIYGRVRIYNLGFAVFTFFSLLLSITWMTGHAGGVWLIVMRIFQGVGRGHAHGQLGGHPDRRLPRRPAGHGPRGSTRPPPSAARSSGWCSAACWPRSTGGWIFLVSVPIGLFATVWGYLSCTRSASGGRPGSTGRATSPSPSG